MAEQIFQWVKSPQYRVINSGFQIVQTADLGEGQKVSIRFASTWLDVEKETIPVEPIPNGFRVSGPATYSMGKFYRIEEVAVQMTPMLAANLIEALLTQAKDWAPDVKQKLKTAIEKFGA